jgi:hypothetical protein
VRLWRHKLGLFAALVLLAACTPRPGSPTPTPNLLGPGESARLPLDAGGAPTVEVPYLQLNLQVTDKQTGKWVDNAVIAVDEHELGRGCCLTVMIEATTAHTLTVEATGYAPWSVELKPHIKHNTVMTAPVELEPLRPEAGAKPQLRTRRAGVTQARRAVPAGDVASTYDDRPLMVKSTIVARSCDNE